MKPLAGLRVVDLTQAMAAPFCSMNLADMGVVLDDRAGEDDGPDADAHVVADRAAVHDGAMADRHALADDAGRLRHDVHDRVVLHVGVAADADVLAFVAPSASSTLPMTSAAGSTHAPG